MNKYERMKVRKIIGFLYTQQVIFRGIMKHFCFSYLYNKYISFVYIFTFCLV